MQKKEVIIVIFLILWVICGKNLFVSQLVSLKKAMYLFPLSLDRQYQLIDGQLYSYVKFLFTQIPENAKVLFINNNKEVEKFSPLWVKSVYDRERLNYYLYPRIFVQHPSDRGGVKEYRIVYTLTPQCAVFDLYPPGQECNVSY